MLYPQTASSPYLPANPQACWDWWSYVDHQDSSVTNTAAQNTAIKAMLDALTAAAKTATAAAPPPGTAPGALTVFDTSDTGADLVWVARGGATAYRVWRAGADGQFAAVGDVVGPSFGDSGLAPQSTYRWRVTAIVGGTEGPASNETAAITRSTPAPCDSPGSCPLGN